MSRKGPNKWSYEYIQEIVKKRGLEENGIEGKLITTKEKFKKLIQNEFPSLVKLKWWCGKKQHEPWETTGSEIKRSWCYKCFIEKRSFSHQYLKELARKKGLEETGIEGKLLTTKEQFLKLIQNQSPSQVKLKWWCNKEEHKPWETVAIEIKGYSGRKGTWCLICFNESRMISYEYLLDLAKKRGLEETSVEGKLITIREKFEKIIQQYGEPSKKKLKWWCGIKEHESWDATPNSISRGTWCPHCFRDRVSFSYEYLQDLAKGKGLEEIGIEGKLITTREEFEKLIKKKPPSKTKLKWWCGKKEHEPWEAIPNSIISKRTWCPYCSQGKYERICRWYFEQIFKKKFPKISLSRLIKKYNGKMHLDGYTEANVQGRVIKLAFEYNGYQHYEFPNIYHKSMREFIEQQNRDILKKRMCQDSAIILIEFPYKISPIMGEPIKIQRFIAKEFEKMTGIKLPKLPQFDHRNINKKNKKEDGLVKYI